MSCGQPWGTRTYPWNVFLNLTKHTDEDASRFGDKWWCMLSCFIIPASDNLENNTQPSPKYCSQWRPVIIGTNQCCNTAKQPVGGIQIHSTPCWKINPTYWTGWQLISHLTMYCSCNYSCVYSAHIISTAGTLKGYSSRNSKPWNS